MRKGDLKHILSCTAITSLVGSAILLFWHSGWVLLIAWLTSVLCGVAYEYYQKSKGKHFDQGDIIMNIVGATFGIPLLFIFAMMI